MATLLLQIVPIICVARLFGWVAKQLGQPSVIGEMAAGLLLGPSLFGAVAPVTFARLFPSESFGVLNVLSQIGVILFLFSVGLDFSWRNSSFILGALMNTRGLMELIALNVGYELGVISAEMFTILVVMALVTTMMTGPLVDWAMRRAPASEPISS